MEGFPARWLLCIIGGPCPYKEQRANTEDVMPRETRSAGLFANTIYCHKHPTNNV